MEEETGQCKNYGGKQDLDVRQLDTKWIQQKITKKKLGYPS